MFQPRPLPLLEHQRPVSFDTSREREFYEYLPPSCLNEPLQHFDDNTRSTDFTPRSPSDSVLTAFAQLGALRLNAQRALISLFGQHEQHILAESTRTLSLQDDADHTIRDELWIGNCTMSYNRGFIKPSMGLRSPSPETKEPVWVVPDLTQDEEFKNHPDVTSYPSVRFLASTPIISPKGVMIGAYTVLDDAPRGSLDPTINKFLSDMAITVMDYLVAVRGRSQHLRAERMIVGIGSFLEGKGSLRNSWLDATGKSDYMKDEQGDKPEGSINKIQQEKQVSDGVSESMRKSGRKSSSIRSHEERVCKRRSKGTTKDRHLPLRPLPETTSESSMNPTGCLDSKNDLQSQLGEAFSRGANIVRESIEVEGAIFLDANFGSRGAFVSTENSDHESSGQNSHSSTSGDERQIRGPSDVNASHHTTANAEDSGKDTSKPCRILGFSTTYASSVNDQLSGDNRIAISEPFLAGLLRRYPQGKIFNFFEDGSISTSETSDRNFKPFQGNIEQPKGESSSSKRSKKYKRTRKAILRQDAETLLQLAPESRSIIFSPLWDSHKGRWYSASIAWTQVRHRVFTSNDELSFLFAFGYSMMAEVHRLGSVFSEQSKSSLLAGLSHELRSPLHGIFGMADLLNTSAMNTLQRGFVHTISSCAFTLLGSINQLLEYASIKNLRATSASAQYLGGPSKEKLLKAGQDSQRLEGDEKAYVQMAALIEDAVETVFAGYSFFNGLQFPVDGANDGPFFGAGRFDTPGGVQIILDTARISDWNFLTLSGAWHAILTNIVGNALKFTQHGFVHVSLDVDPVTTIQNGDVHRSKIILTVKDSGCGIGTEFLQKEIFTAFAQEDDMTIGNGLGLNITQRLVLSLGGSIQIDSQRGVGTEVRVSVDLDHILTDSISTAEPLTTQEISTDLSLASAKDLVRDKKVGLFGHWSLDSSSSLRSSLQELCKVCFQMNVYIVSPSQSDSSDCDFYISSFESLTNGDLDIESFVPSPVIVICPSPRIAHSMFVEFRKQGNDGIVEFISQPCGPRKLAKTFEICSKRRQQGVATTVVTDAHPIDIPNAPIATELRESESDSSLALPDPESSGQFSPDDTESKDSESPPDEPELHIAPETSTAAILLSGGDSTAPKLDGVHDLSEPQQDLATTVLIVDDNDINVRILVEFMKRLRCKYAIAFNGLEALEFFKANSPSIAVIFMGQSHITLILMSVYFSANPLADISMPVMDGIESARRIRGFEQKIGITNPVRIIALTGVAQIDLQRDAIGAGMDFFLTKPARMKSLVPLLEGTGAFAGGLVNSSE
ncbi:hypothetical protein N7478_010925 [Penicillium angulare]|uniref:uncharacterized protein n=1 Tax=Penicillium angulare TaxID=116970 RepID=UPI0025405F88|nr:uncharacterized protein N7478_010925 [Penicillium angulare]KAJ5263320.1 hypothetical protein N7478_010925 [Penicillium angulare]